MKSLRDEKRAGAYEFLMLSNEIAIKLHFRKIEVAGLERLPKHGAVLVVANHTSRWDPPIVQHLLGRKANYMTSPKELKGLQGMLVRLVGAFPADSRFDLLAFQTERLDSKEALVIFPEGNVFSDGCTHPFHRGAAKIALQYRAQNKPLVLLPMAITHNLTKNSNGSMKIDPRERTVKINIGEPVDLDMHVKAFMENKLQAVKDLSASLHREVSYLRLFAGVTSERNQLEDHTRVKQWVKRSPA